MIRQTISAAGIVLLLCPLSARALDFDYVKIADTSTAVPDGSAVPFGLFQQPALNGYSVAFRGNKAAVGGGSLGKDALYISSGGSLTQIASNSTAIPAGSGTFNAFGDPSPSGGSIAFSGTNNLTPTGIYSNIGGLNRLADLNTPIPSGTGNFTSFGAATSLDGGNILFYGLGASSQQGLYSSSGGLHAVANTSTPIPGGAGNFTSFSNGASLNGGNVAFTGAGSSGQSGVYTDAGGTLHAVADKNTLTPQAPVNFSSFGAAPSLSGGNVAFYATSSAQADGIYTDIGGLNVVADHSTPVPGGTGNFTILGSTPSLSNGSVAFYGTGGGLSGIFTNYGGTPNAVVTNAMFLDGKKISGFFGSVGISPRANSNGNVAFFTTFSDNSSGVYVAEQSYDYATNATGTWDTASNWSFGLKPRTVVSTNIHPTNGIVVTGPSSATTIRGLDLGATTSGQAELRLQASGQLTVSEYLYVEALGKLSLNGGVATAVSGVYNYGDIDLGGGQLNGGFLSNSGTLYGTGTVGNYVYNYNKIQAIGTQMTFTQPVYNLVSAASIQARNALLHFNGGLSNAGSVNFSFGTSDVFGAVNNVAADPMAMTPGGQIIVSGNSNVTFYDPVVHNGDVFRVSTGSTVVFFGQVSGAGAFTGTGTKFFEGGYSPGNSPAAVALDGPVNFGDTNTLTIELGGTTVGTQFDKVSVAGQLNIGGALDVVLYNGFKPVVGNSFDILDWSTGGLTGTFSSVALPTMNGRIVWNSSQLYTTGALTVSATYFAGDINRDGLVTVADISALMMALADVSKYRSDKSLTDPTLFKDVADVNGDGFVNNLDIQSLISIVASSAAAGAVPGSFFGNGNVAGSGNQQVTAVPEPASILLFCIGALAIAFYRRCGSIALK